MFLCLFSILYIRFVVLHQNREQRIKTNRNVRKVAILQEILVFSLLFSIFIIYCYEIYNPFVYILNTFRDKQLVGSNMLQSTFNIII